MLIDSVQQLRRSSSAVTLECEVRPCSYDDLKPFILGIHYAHVMPTSVMYKFGLFHNGDLVGVVTYGRTAAPAPSVGMFGKEERHRVIELNRLVLLPEYNHGNYTSFLVGNSLRMLPPGMGVISYADFGGQGHTGGVYRACNFLYTGDTKPRTDALSASGGHARHYQGDLTKRQVRTAKCKYVTFTGSRTDKRKLRKMLKWEVMDFNASKHSRTV